MVRLIQPRFISLLLVAQSLGGRFDGVFNNYERRLDDAFILRFTFATPTCQDLRDIRYSTRYTFCDLLVEWNVQYASTAKVTDDQLLYLYQFEVPLSSFLPMRYLSNQASFPL